MGRMKQERFFDHWHILAGWRWQKKWRIFIAHFGLRSRWNSFCFAYSQRFLTHRAGVLDNWPRHLRESLMINTSAWEQLKLDLDAVHWSCLFHSVLQPSKTLGVLERCKNTETKLSSEECSELKFERNFFFSPFFFDEETLERKFLGISTFSSVFVDRFENKWRKKEKFLRESGPASDIKNIRKLKHFWCAFSSMLMEKRPRRKNQKSSF